MKTLLLIGSDAALDRAADTVRQTLASKGVPLLKDVAIDAASKAFSPDADLPHIAPDDAGLILCRSGKPLSAVPTSFFDGYDAVFLLPDKEEKAKIDANDSAKCLWLGAFAGHPHLRCFFSMDAGACPRFARELIAFLGVPEPKEVERKYLIRYPDTAMLAGLPFCRSVSITQVYLRSAKGVTLRVRRRDTGDGVAYFRTEKIRGATPESCTERETTITESDYLSAVKTLSDPARSPILKTRWCLLYGERVFEIDVYPFWKKQAVMEIELSDEDDRLSPSDFPPYLTILRDVTDDFAYKNSRLAQVIPPEDGGITEY